MKDATELTPKTAELYFSAISVLCSEREVCLQALAALFLMNNAHYQLKAVQGNTYLKLISKEWQDDCEAKVGFLISL